MISTRTLFELTSTQQTYLDTFMNKHTIEKKSSIQLYVKKVR